MSINTNTELLQNLLTVANSLPNIEDASLNFKVVGGTTEPASPSENMIWVNTDTPITWWGIGDYNHSPGWSTPDGYVYINADTSTNNGGDFNALKKNEIWLRPNRAIQRVNGAWVDKTAKIYQNGAWVDWWDGQLYENGNQFTGVTGGWGIHNYITDSRPLIAAEHKSDQMFFQAQNDHKVLMGIGNPVDLSDVNQIRITGKINKVFPYNGAVYGLHIDVLKTKDLASKVARFSMLVEEVFDYTLNVSSLNGEHYVIIWADGNANIQGYITGVYLN